MISKIKISIISLVLALLAMPGLVSAAAPSASLKAAGGSYLPSAQFSVPITVDSSASVNVVDAELVYNPSELDFVSVDTSNSDFAGALRATGGQGEVSIIRFSATPLTGQKLIAVVNFKALDKVAASEVDFANNSGVAGSGQKMWDQVNNAANLTFAAPSQKPTPPPISQTVKQPIAQAPPKKTTARVKPQARPSPSPSVKALTTSAVPLASVPLDQPPTSSLLEMLAAALLAAVAMVAMYLDAHVRFYNHSRVRLAHKRMLIQTKLKVKWQG